MLLPASCPTTTWYGRSAQVTGTTSASANTSSAWRADNWSDRNECDSAENANAWSDPATEDDDAADPATVDHARSDIPAATTSWPIAAETTNVAAKARYAAGHVWPADDTRCASTDTGQSAT